MCCRVDVIGFPDNWQEILTKAGFAVASAYYWSRRLSPSVSVSVSRYQDTLSFQLQPTISEHDLAAHQANAQNAAIVYKVAMTLAEMAGGKIVQKNMMNECKIEAGKSDLEIADYSKGRYLEFASLCLGFRTVLLPGAPQIGEPLMPGEGC